MFNNRFDWLSKWAKYTPDKLTLRDFESGREWTFSELNNRVNSLAEFLSESRGIKKGDRI